jgi:hypothetical protein
MCRQNVKTATLYLRSVIFTEALWPGTRVRVGKPRRLGNQQRRNQSQIRSFADAIWELAISLDLNPIEQMRHYL